MEGLLLLKLVGSARRARVTYTISVLRQQPLKLNFFEQTEEKGKYSRRQKSIEQLRAIKSIGHAVKSIEYRVSKIVPQGRWLKNKGRAILRGSGARKRISIKMCDQSKALYMPGLGVDKPESDSLIFFFKNFNISSVFGIHDTLLSYKPSGLHLQTPRPGAVEDLTKAPLVTSTGHIYGTGRVPK